MLIADFFHFKRRALREQPDVAPANSVAHRLARVTLIFDATRA
jgi:hypothetical protein